jgi:hypothetical protein
MAAEKEKKAFQDDASMAKQRFELENEIIEEELYKFDEAEVDKLFEDKPWKSK